MAKVTVVCKTCGITESFYSDLSVEAFKLRHKGHDVEGGRPRAAPAQAKPSLTPLELPEDGFGTKVSRVVVDLVEFPALQEPAFRVRGYIDGIDEAFALTSPASEAARLKELLAGGRYLAKEPRKLFVWEAYAVDYEEGVREKLEVDASPMEEASPVEVVPRVEAVPPLEEAPTEEPAVEAEELKLEPPAPVAAVPARMVEVVEKEPEEYLLVSKSWYVQGGEQNRREAVRISRALREFRWRVEPMYTLGVMLDDIVSIESARNEIGREVIQALEGTGYRLTVITAEQGKVVAWFKKTGTEAPPAETPALAPADDRGTTGGDQTAPPVEAAPVAVEAPPTQ